MIIAVDLLEPFSYEFFRNGLIIATLAGALCGLIGVFVVLRGMSYIGHGLSHAVFGGAALAAVLNLNYFIGAGLLPEDRRAHEWELVNLYIAGLESYGHEINHDWIRNHYRREAISGVIMAVIASQIVGRTDRGDKMFEAMGTRHVLQGLENDSFSLL